MRAAVLRQAGGALTVEDVKLAEPHTGELRVRVKAAGVCHTELHYMSGDMSCPLPVVLGHEGVGVVEQVGPGVDDIRVGETVSFTWRPRCGKCEYCITGRPVLCVYGRVQARSGGLIDGTTRLLDATGEQVHHFLGVSCFAEEAVVSRTAVVPIPADLPAQVAAIAGCAVVTGVGAVINLVAGSTGSVTGRTLLVIGAGGVGLSAVMGARLVGAARIIVVDMTADKLALAAQLGATDTLDVAGRSSDEVVATIAELTSGGADVAIDAVGAPVTLAQAISGVRPGGTAVAVGLSSVDATVAVPINELVQQQKHLVGSLYGSANPPVDLPRLLSLYRAGRLPLDQLIGTTYALETVNDAYDALRIGVVGRGVIVPDSAGPKEIA